MMNYFGELMVIVGAMIVGCFVIRYLVKLVFGEITKYKIAQEQRSEKSLNKVLDGFKNTFQSFADMYTKIMTNSKKETETETNMWDEDLK